MQLANVSTMPMPVSLLPHRRQSSVTATDTANGNGNTSPTRAHSLSLIGESVAQTTDQVLADYDLDDFINSISPPLPTDDLIPSHSRPSARRTSPHHSSRTRPSPSRPHRSNRSTSGSSTLGSPISASTASQARPLAEQGTSNFLDLESALVDLTGPAPSLPMAEQSRKRLQGQCEGSDMPSSAKRRKQSTPPQSQGLEDSTVERVDLLDVYDGTGLAQVLRKQQEDTVRAQQGDDDAPVRLSSLQCVICLEPPKNLTTTICGKRETALLIRGLTNACMLPGHLFCHTCLMEALIAGEQNSSRCPVCRTPVSRMPRPGKRDGGEGKHWQPLELKFVRKSKKGKEPATNT